MSMQKKHLISTPVLKFIAYTVAVLYMGIIWYRTSSMGNEPYWTEPMVTHSASVSELWKLSDIYMGEGLKPELVAVKGKLILLGSDEINQRNGVIALDELSGNIIWRSGFDALSIATVGSTVIVGGFSEVMALDSVNGQILWSINVRSNVGRIEVTDNLIYAFGGGNYTYVLDPLSGKVLNKLEGPFQFWQEPSLGNTIYRTGRADDVMAIDQLSGQELWRTEAKIISNLEPTPSYIYALDLKGDLFRLNPLTGQPESLIQFTSAPFNLQNYNNGVYYHYYLATDTDANLLFAYLGDSAQLFAFQLPRE